MGAPGTTVAAAEKPVMRAVVRLMSEVAEAMSVRKRIVVDWCGCVEESWVWGVVELYSVWW